MGQKGARRSKLRTRSIEYLEERQVMSADPVGQLLGGSISQHSPADQPVEQHGTIAGAPSLAHHSQRDADFWLDPNSERDLGALMGEVEQTLASAHGLSGLTQVRNNYGFVGTGQTVAIIDSGIAWDHYALGGGLGSNYRVVGGWDFTDEWDANPYDDGPEGSHGTHVAGIVGADRNGTGDDGVAPGVDLVGLRVFDDQGNGYFSWVESALQWVHQHRNSFENPITAVNLSLGTAWNSAAVPLWAMLESEFRQLEADGIFVAVSAGNDFASYNMIGLSYPAASQYVVPVMAADDSGNLSHFSQRHPRAIAAPGRFIVSTIPDYTGNHNGVADDFASYSGTSMAAPYVAGASVLLREAMQFVGYANITQDTIFNHMMATADSFFDAATRMSYKRLNLANAISTLMPADEYGSTSDTAHRLGTLVSGQSIAGLIGTLDDKDFFTFSAGSSGTVHLSVTGTHGLEPVLSVAGGNAVREGNAWSFDVVAGQGYTFSVATSAGDGIGYYNADLTLEQSVEKLLTTVKTIVQGNGTVFSLDSENWLSVNGSRVWNKTYDFTIGGDGTLYWQSTYGLLQQQLAGGRWVDLDHDSTKFAVGSSGTVYSLGRDGWMSVNGANVWHGTQDFSLACHGTLYWQCMSGLLQHRLANGVWEDLDNGIERFAVCENGTVYSLSGDGWLKVNGSRVWQQTQDFVLAADQSLYWHSNYGLLQRLPDQGTWETLGEGVTKFAVRQDGAVYSLMDDGRVLVDGVHKWSNVIEMRADNCGALVLERTDGTEFTDAGHFVVSKESMVDSNAVGTAGIQPADTVAANHSFNFVAASMVDIGDAGADRILDTFDLKPSAATMGNAFTLFSERRATADNSVTYRASEREYGENNTSTAWEQFSSEEVSPLDESSDALRAAIEDMADGGIPSEMRNAMDALFAQIGN